MRYNAALNVRVRSHPSEKKEQFFFRSARLGLLICRPQNFSFGVEIRCVNWLSVNQRFPCLRKSCRQCGDKLIHVYTNRVSPWNVRCAILFHSILVIGNPCKLGSCTNNPVLLCLIMFRCSWNKHISFYVIYVLSGRRDYSVYSDTTWRQSSCWMIYFHMQSYLIRLSSVLSLKSGTWRDAYADFWFQKLSWY